MNKRKEVILVFTAIFLSILMINSIYVQAATTESDIKEGVGKLEDTTNKIRGLEDKDTQNKFINQEWTYFLNKTSSGKIIVNLNDGVKKMDPFWKLVLGVDYSFSWSFFFALIIWFILFFIMLPPAEILFRNKIYAIVGSFAIASLIGLAGVIEKATDLLSVIINNKISAILIFGLTVVLLVIAKKTDQLWKRLKEKEAKKKEEQDREILSAEAENIKKQTKPDKK